MGAHVHSRHRHRGGYLVGAKHQELARHALVLVVLIDNHAARGPWKVARFLPLLLTPVLLLASTFPGEYRVPAAYWVLAVAECLLYPLAERWPFAVSVAISALALPIFVIEAWGPSELLRYLGAVALVEVIVRCNRASGALATACWAAVVVVGMWNSQNATLRRAAEAGRRRHVGGVAVPEEPDEPEDEEPEEPDDAPSFPQSTGWPNYVVRADKALHRRGSSPP